MPGQLQYDVNWERRDVVDLEWKCNKENIGKVIELDFKIKIKKGEKESTDGVKEESAK